MTTTNTDVHAELRAWAKGLYPLEAATELLIRGGWAAKGRPWVQEGENGGWWIDFASIPDHIGALSGGERRFLMLAASIGSHEVQVSLEDTLPGLDRGKVDLVLAAAAHAAGTHEGRGIVFDADGQPTGFGDPYESLHPWP